MSWAAKSMVCGKMWVRVAHRFLIALSVRPGNILTISDQRVPYKWTASTIARSSAGVHPVLDTCRSRRQSGKGETWRIGWAKIRTPLGTGGCASVHGTAFRSAPRSHSRPPTISPERTRWA